MQHLNCPFELKAAGGKGKFEGYGAVFGNKDLGDDVILEGAFEKIKKTKDGKVRIALYHDLWQLAGKADVHMDSTGLYVEGQLNMKVSYVPDAYELMKDGTLDGMSVGFNILPGGDTWVEDDDGSLVRIISKAELWEVSIVPFGMNPEAKIDNVKGGINDIRAVESFLRKHGFSRSEAVAIAAGGYKSLQREADNGGLSDSAPVTSEMLGDLKQTLMAEFKL